MARLVNGRWVPEDEDDFKDWDADKFVQRSREIIAAARQEFPHPLVTVRERLKSEKAE